MAEAAYDFATSSTLLAHSFSILFSTVLCFSVPTEEQLEKLKRFVEEFAGQLRDIEDAIDQSSSEVS